MSLAVDRVFPDSFKLLWFRHISMPHLPVVTPQEISNGTASEFLGFAGNSFNSSKQLAVGSRLKKHAVADKRFMTRTGDSPARRISPLLPLRTARPDRLRLTASREPESAE